VGVARHELLVDDFVLRGSVSALVFAGLGSVRAEIAA